MAVRTTTLDEGRAAEKPPVQWTTETTMRGQVALPLQQQRQCLFSRGDCVPVDQRHLAYQPGYHPDPAHPRQKGRSFRRRQQEHRSRYRILECKYREC